MAEDKNWRTVPFLRVLRPEPGETVEGAVLATYSTDLVVVAAALFQFAPGFARRAVGQAQATECVAGDRIDKSSSVTAKNK